MSQIIDVVIPAYNAADTICDTVRHIARQQVPDGWQLNIYVSDDGSTDETPALVTELRQATPQLHLVRADTNAGRSRTCNAGIAAGSGAVVVVCDADCRYTRDDAIVEFLGEIGRGADVVIGLVELPGHGFWARYTNSVTAERVAAETSKGLMAYTTANVAMRRSAFERVGGFAEDYGSYGFEDKDLLIRIERADLPTVVREDIRVSHDDDLTLAKVCRKAEQSGAHSAAVFRDRFGDAYKQLPYARCDATMGGSKRIFKALSLPLRHLAGWCAAVAILLPRPFFRLQRFTVRVAVCAAYFRGTTRQVAERVE